MFGKIFSSFSDSETNKENILFSLSSILLSYFILHSTIQFNNKKYYLYFIILTIVLFFFFKFITYDKSSDLSIEKYTNGLDDTDNFYEDYSDDYSSYETSGLSGTSETSGILEISGTSSETSGISTEEISGISETSGTSTVETSGISETSGTPSETSSETSGTPSETSGTPSETSGTPDISSHIWGELKDSIINNPTTGNAYGPLNINVSYNGVVDDNNKDKKRKKRDCDPVNPHTDNLDDMGRYNYKSRVHNNSQWMDNWESDNYGKQAWTNQPDLYVPGNNDYTKAQPSINNRPHFQNELNYRHNQKSEKCTICPVEINNPWSPYMSGDNKNGEPQPFNL